MARGNVFVRAWRYLRTALGMKFDEAADPRVQLEQAIQEAQDQHRRLKEQAATVIANQKQTEAKLDRSMDELDKLTGNAQQALLMAEEARGAGDDAKAAEYERAAETIATKLIAVEAEVEDLKSLHLDAVKASDQAKNAVAQNSATLQKKLSERQQLLSQLDQAKMAETMTEAMASLSETVGQDTPTFTEVRDKIEARLAKAQGGPSSRARPSRPACSRSSRPPATSTPSAACRSCGRSWASPGRLPQLQPRKAPSRPLRHAESEAPPTTSEG